MTSPPTSSSAAAWVPLAQWPRGSEVPGLYESWEGYAWVELQRALVDRFVPRASWWNALTRRLEQRLAQPPSPHCGELVGETSLLTLSVLAARLEPQRFSPFIASAQARVEQCALADGAPLDLTTGLCGAFVGLLQLRETYRPRRLLRSLYARLERGARRQLASDTPMTLGLAHGIAGFMLALELGHSVEGWPDRHDTLTRCLEVLLETPLVDEQQRVWWPVRSGPAATAGGFTNAWCHGNAGIALAAFLCRAVSGRGDYTSLLRAASGTLLVPTPLRTLCCGSVGRAHIVLEMMRRSRGRARRGHSDRLASLLSLVDSTPPIPPTAQGLFKGPLGELYLRERLASPRPLPLPASGPFLEIV